jgi:TPR repeat protein
MLRVILLALALTLSACVADVPVAAGTFEDGVAAYERGDYETALRLWRSLAEQGNVYAQYNLGAMYDEGKGVPQDHAEAVKRYRKAAEQGFARAQLTPLNRLLVWLEQTHPWWASGSEIPRRSFPLALDVAGQAHQAHFAHPAHFVGAEVRQGERLDQRMLHLVMGDNRHRSGKKLKPRG